MKNDYKISIVSPVYQAEKIVDELVRQITKSVSQITDDFEIILVEDGGDDNSWGKITENCAQFSFVKGIKLSRNFGQHYAITAGITKAKGDFIVLMDCDLQDDPIFIPILFKESQKGFDIVFSRRKKRKHGLVKSILTWIYIKLFRFFSDRKYEANVGTMVFFSKKVARVFLELKDKDRIYFQMLKWLGFRTSIVEIDHRERFEGKTTYSFRRLLKIGIQGWTSHSDKLLKWNIYLGLFLALGSFMGGIYVLILKFFYDFQPGWPSLFISILFSTGLILLSIGIVGIYIGKIFEQVKDRPLYVIEEEVN